MKHLSVGLQLVVANMSMQDCVVPEALSGSKQSTTPVVPLTEVMHAPCAKLSLRYGRTSSSTHIVANPYEALADQLEHVQNLQYGEVANVPAGPQQKAP